MCLLWWASVMELVCGETVEMCTVSKSFVNRDDFSFEDMFEWLVNNMYEGKLVAICDERDDDASARYWQAGLTTARSLLAEPYLSTDDIHQGLLLHTIYHQPRGWDHVPAGSKIPHSESCMWGDYHLRELALYIQRVANESLPYYSFFGPNDS